MMAGPTTKELEHERLMASLGVRPLPRGKQDVAGPGKGRPRTLPPAPAPTPPPRPTARPMPPPSSPTAELLLVEARDEGLRLRTELDGLRQKLVEVDRGHAVWEERVRAAEAARDQSRFDLEAMDSERRQLARKVTDLNLRPPPRPVRSLGDLLQERGCVDGSEQVQTLVGLLSLHPDELLPRLVVPDAEALAGVLAERLVFVGEKVSWNDPETVALRVPQARCEVSGGSDISDAWAQLIVACVRLRYRTLCIVGGSPAYRKQLRRLSDGTAVPELNLVSGTQRRPRHKADADLRAADVVVIWGATMLDHSVTAAYEGTKGRLLRIPHRGIGRMLSLLAEEL